MDDLLHGFDEVSILKNERSGEGIIGITQEVTVHNPIPFVIGGAESLKQGLTDDAGVTTSPKNAPLGRASFVVSLTEQLLLDRPGVALQLLTEDERHPELTINYRRPKDDTLDGRPLLHSFVEFNTGSRHTGQELLKHVGHDSLVQQFSK